ncbi:M23 family metallopeptidase [Corynebacterium pyruviciproducens]|uniref:M23 family metallopeptidase n=1 Tax=Corynebacterium pyruviciproducens TaxID=598660 RepID=UPI002550849F|nr:M23 family metallopeptidase [Corynebacterium pyruviciproducens]MDK7215094.1 M23 family metallopeptidase [Corynebacterium pyruviciproducens]
MAHQRSAAGAHRKPSSAPKGRISLVAVTTGVVSTAGATGAVAANTFAEAAPTVHNEVQLVAETTTTTASTAEESPQVLNIAEFKPAANVQDQIAKAVQYDNERAAADEAARAPLVVRPAEGVLSSGFGTRWGVLHAGVDIAGPMGSSIVAAEDGVVIDAGPASGFGNWVRIQHEDGTVTVYGHMETVETTVGAHVTAGQRIAGIGSRGFSTGPHLHFEVHPNGGGAIDPIPWLAELGINL